MSLLPPFGGFFLVIATPLLTLVHRGQPIQLTRFYAQMTFWHYMA